MSDNSGPTLEQLTSLAKRRGFIFQGSEIYGGLAGTWDYGPLGVQLKRNIQNLWWKMFVEDRDDMYGLDSAIIMPEKVFEASGHLANFKDPMVVCKNCHSQFRADHLYSAFLESISSKPHLPDEFKDAKDIKSKVNNVNIPCPKCGKTGTFSDPRMFNMMLKTRMGALENEKSPQAYLRPETAQGIFTNFKNVVDSYAPNIPFGIAQIGKAFRNEISPRDFIFRAREFEQMEIEYFIKPDGWQKHFDSWVKAVYEFLEATGLAKVGIHELEVPKEDRAHYSERTIDFEFDYPFGRSELLGLAYRTDYDLTNHQKVSAKKLEYLPKDGTKPFVPHVIEPSFGVDRLVLAILTSLFREEDGRTWLALPEAIAPIKYAVAPLARNKLELVKKAREVYTSLQKKHGLVEWHAGGNIGKFYARSDEIGTPHCITVDFETLENDTVTIRDRDTTKQERVKLDELQESR